MPDDLGNFRSLEEHCWRHAETTNQIAPLPGSLHYEIIRGRLSAADIGNWLRGLGLAQYEPAFHDNDVGAEVLLRLTADDLRELGLHRSAIAGGYWTPLPH
jgi:SAM domain (Sterile alpha motif)